MAASGGHWVKSAGGASFVNSGGTGGGVPVSKPEAKTDRGPSWFDPVEEKPTYPAGLVGSALYDWAKAERAAAKAAMDAADQRYRQSKNLDQNALNAYNRAAARYMNARDILDKFREARKRR